MTCTISAISTVYLIGRRDLQFVTSTASVFRRCFIEMKSQIPNVPNTKRPQHYPKSPQQNFNNTHRISTTFIYLNFHICINIAIRIIHIPHHRYIHNRIGLLLFLFILSSRAKNGIHRPNEFEFHH